MNGFEILATLATLLTIRIIAPLFLVFSLGSLLKKAQVAS
jgi:hypothetical protein